jgi:hypothetical protein
VAAARPGDVRGAGGLDIGEIDTYLDELRRCLGRDPFFRRRVLAEVEDHLREAARDGGEAAAVARFGAPELVARGFAGERAVGAALWASAALLLAAAGFVVAYLAAENSLPPAPWPSEAATPSHLRWKLAAAEAGFAVGLAAALGASLVAWRRRVRLALALAGLAAVALGTAVALSAVESFQRAALYEELALSGRPSRLALALGSASLALLTGLAGGAVAWAGRVWATAQRASRSYGFSR